MSGIEVTRCKGGKKECLIVCSRGLVDIPPVPFKFAIKVEQ